jgi:hypothetical protein
MLFAAAAAFGATRQCAPSCIDNGSERCSGGFTGEAAVRSHGSVPSHSHCFFFASHARTPAADGLGQSVEGVGTSRHSVWWRMP